MSAISNFTDAVCQVLEINGASLTTANNTSNLWSTSTLDIGNAWLTDGNPDLAAAINAIDNKTDPTSIGYFFNNLFKNYQVGDWSMSLITELQSKIAQFWDKDQGGIWNGMVSQMSSLIQSQSGQDTSTGDAESKACQSALQNASSAGQPVSNAGDSVLGLLSSGSSVQAQISA